MSGSSGLAVRMCALFRSMILDHTRSVGQMYLHGPGLNKLVIGPQSCA